MVSILADRTPTDRKHRSRRLTRPPLKLSRCPETTSSQRTPHRMLHRSGSTWSTAAVGQERLSSTQESQAIFCPLDLRDRKQTEEALRYGRRGGLGCGPSIIARTDCGLNGSPCSLQKPASFSLALISR